MENDDYIVLDTADAGAYEGNSLTTYTIQCKATGEVRLLESCLCLEMELFDDEDFEQCSIVTK